MSYHPYHWKRNRSGYVNCNSQDYIIPQLRKLRQTAWKAKDELMAIETRAKRAAKSKPKTAAATVAAVAAAKVSKRPAAKPNPPTRNPPTRNPPTRNPPTRNPPIRNPPLRNPSTPDPVCTRVVHFKDDINSEADLPIISIRYPRVVDFENNIDIKIDLFIIQTCERIQELQIKVA